MRKGWLKISAGSAASQRMERARRRSSCIAVVPLAAAQPGEDDLDEGGPKDTYEIGGRPSSTPGRDGLRWQAEPAGDNCHGKTAHPGCDQPAQKNVPHCIAYPPKALADQFDTRLPEMRRFLGGKLDAERTEEITTMLRRAGLPI